jgi:protein-S-isoprenylcysteine O-methyltransferase Ste14
MVRVFLKANMYAVLVIGFFLVLVPLAVISFAGRQPLSVPPGLLQVLPAFGLLVGLAGGSLSYTCMTTFVLKGHGTAFPTDPPRKFVVLGPYRYVRNPMYIGNLVLAFGVGIFLASGTYLIYVIALAVVTHFYVVLSEEPQLEQRFGQDYLDYCKTTNRWIPKFKVASRLISQSN